jgi:hypothetical protein
VSHAGWTAVQQVRRCGGPEPHTRGSAIVAGGITPTRRVVSTKKGVGAYWSSGCPRVSRCWGTRHCSNCSPRPLSLMSWRSMHERPGQATWEGGAQELTSSGKPPHTCCSAAVLQCHLLQCCVTHPQTSGVSMEAETSGSQSVFAGQGEGGGTRLQEAGCVCGMPQDHAAPSPPSPVLLVARVWYDADSGHALTTSSTGGGAVGACMTWGLPGLV